MEKLLKKDHESLVKLVEDIKNIDSRNHHENFELLNEKSIEQEAMEEEHRAEEHAVDVKH